MNFTPQGTIRVLNSPGLQSEEDVFNLRANQNQTDRQQAPLVNADATNTGTVRWRVWVWSGARGDGGVRGGQQRGRTDSDSGETWD